MTACGCTICGAVGRRRGREFHIGCRLQPLLFEHENLMPGPRQQERGEHAPSTAITARIGSHITLLYEVLAVAAGSDSEIAEMYRRQQEARYKDQRRVVQSLSRRGALRAGLSVAHATDIMWTIANPRTHRTLIIERQWSTSEYESWLAEVLACALLTDPSK